MIRRLLVATALLLLVCSTPLASARFLVLPTGTVTVEATGPTGAVYTFDDTGLTCNPASGFMFPLGDTTVDCGVDGSFVVHVVDTTPPVVTPPADVTVTTGDPGGTTVTYPDATATDAVAGTPTASCLPASGGNFTVGTTVVTCTATDGPNIGSATFNVIVNLVDSVPPILSVPTLGTTEATGPGGAAVAFSVTAVDAIDPSPTVNCDHASGATFPLGTTSVTCTAKDASNNVSAPQSFNVAVADTTAPTFSSIPSGTVAIEAAGASGASYSFSVSATDAVTASPAISCNHGPSTATYPLGTTHVSCTATDTGGVNPNTQGFDVLVADTVAPAITSIPTGTVVREATGPGGATYSFSVSATDAVTASPTITCNHGPGAETYVPGITHVSCTAKDAADNISSASTFDVDVRDTTAPTVTVPATITKEATGPSGAVATFTVSAADSVDPAPTVSCDHASGATYALGTTPVSCTATDAASNTSAPSIFSVVVRDTTKPDIPAQSNVSAEATSSAGATVTYPAVNASDTVDGTIAANCSPASGSTFHLGDNTVTCNATDAHGNAATPKTFTITVVDTTGPAFTGGSGDLTVQANGPLGSVVNYVKPTAVDLVDGPVAGVGCAPGSGTVFALGTTTVTCSATDSHGNPSSKTIHVTVVDTTPPSLTVPTAMSIYATTPTGIPDTVAGIVAFLTGASASDIVDGNVPVTTDAPHFLPLGNLTVVFLARDRAGNAVSRQVPLIVLPQPPPGTPELPLPPAVKPPADVRNLKATSGDHTVRLVWLMPAGVAYVTVTRWTSVARRTAAEAPGEIVYKGTGTSYVDRGLQNGLEYRYVVTSYDSAGNGSAGVPIVVVPRRDLLQAPKNGARLRKAPRLVWEVDRKAAYYNAQLIRGGQKILSVWPTKAQYVLKKTWKFEGRKYSLTPGIYQWYVWPGYGPRSAADYGELLGTRTFQILP